MTHYEVLGISPRATADEVKSAHRKLVLKHHPDHSNDPKSVDIFIRVTQAYEILGDAERREEYDLTLRFQASVEEKKRQMKNAPKGAPEKSSRAKIPDPPPPRPRPKAPDPPPAASRPSSVNVPAEVTRLTLLFAKGRHQEAERLANGLRLAEPRHPIPYAILGDIARMRGDRATAIKMYAYAVQMDPHNATYQKRYEELLAVTGDPTQPTENSSGNIAIAPVVGCILALISAMYIVLGKEPAAFPNLFPISSWTFGFLAMAIIAGVAIGASFSVGKIFDRFSSSATTSIGSISPALALTSIAVVNFWVAAALYGILAYFQKSFMVTTTRLIFAVGATTLVLACAAHFGGTVQFVQALLWGGNLVYLGAICGWMVADSLRR